MRRRPTTIGAVAFLLIAGGIAAAQQPISAQQASATTLPDFSVVSIKRNLIGGQGSALYTDDGVAVQNAPLLIAIRMAYSRIGSSDEEFAGVPDWARIERFDIQAKVDPSDVEKYQKLTRAEKAVMLQKLLADRFKLKVHEEPREQAGYDLVIAKGEAKVKQAEPGPGITVLNSHEMKAEGYKISSLCVPLSQIIGRTVEDKTGLQGTYDFSLNWAPQDAGDATDAGPSIFTALEEQLGLRLAPAKHQVMVLVIDRAEKPGVN